MVPAPQTLERSYLLRVNGVVVERPQHMLMRVSVGIHKEVRQGVTIILQGLAEVESEDEKLEGL